MSKMVIWYKDAFQFFEHIDKFMQESIQNFSREIFFQKWLIWLHLAHFMFCKVAGFWAWKIFCFQSVVFNSVISCISDPLGPVSAGLLSFIVRINFWVWCFLQINIKLPTIGAINAKTNQHRSKNLAIFW